MLHQKYILNLCFQMGTFLSNKIIACMNSLHSSNIIYCFTHFLPLPISFYQSIILFLDDPRNK